MIDWEKVREEQGRVRQLAIETATQDGQEPVLFCLYGGDGAWSATFNGLNLPVMYSVTSVQAEARNLVRGWRELHAPDRMDMPVPYVQIVDRHTGQRVFQVYRDGQYEGACNSKDEALATIRSNEPSPSNPKPKL